MKQAQSILELDKSGQANQMRAASSLPAAEVSAGVVTLDPAAGSVSQHGARRQADDTHSNIQGIRLPSFF